MFWDIDASGHQVTEVVGFTHDVLGLFEGHWVMRHVYCRLGIETKYCGPVQVNREVEAEGAHMGSSAVSAEWRPRSDERKMPYRS